MLVEAGWPGSTSFRALCGGEPMPRDLADALLDRAAEVWNLYGPTETTVWSTLERVRRGAPITVGRPIANTQAYVLGRAGELQPPGVSGELWIGGDGLADGYLGQPELTAQRFLSNPFVPGTRMYGTGDVVRWTADGRLEHLGRSDDQVKIRGFRIELGEIETALAAHPSVRQAAAVAFGAAGDARIVAYVVPAGTGIDATALRQHARERLPEYMVPAVVLPLAALPTTSNGKLDRKALLASTAAALLNAGGERPRSTARRTPVEDTLASIWADVLGVKKVGIDDDFFELGGHSLLAARLMQQLSDIFWMDLPLRLLFDAPTIARMAAVIQQRLDTKHADESTTDVLEINTSGTRPPFVFLHAALQGDGFYCFNLARHLGEDQPMYALAPLGLDGSETPPTVEAIAAKQLQIIRRIQPRGPYYLGGFCSSGPIAFELARMLKAAGERVEIVVLIESDIDECNRVVRFTDRAVGAMARVVRLSPAQRLTAFLVLRRWLRRAARLSDSTVREGATSVVNKVRSVVSTRVSALRQWRARACDSGRPATARARQHALSDAVGWRYDRAIEGFVPQRYDGRVVALKAEESLSIDTTVAWRTVAPDLRLQVVKGDHNTCLTTQVDSLGTHLRNAARSTGHRTRHSGNASERRWMSGGPDQARPTRRRRRILPLSANSHVHCSVTMSARQLIIVRGVPAVCRAIVMTIAASIAIAPVHGAGSQQPPATPAAQPVFWCPMHPDIRGGAGDKCPQCGMALVRAAPADYGAYLLDFDIVPRALLALQKARVRFFVREPHTHETVRRFELVHERVFHLFIVSRDLEYFAHVHPTLHADGSLDVDVELPRPGVYQMIADFVPTGGLPQLVQKSFVTAGLHRILSRSHISLRIPPTKSSATRA